MIEKIVEANKLLNEKYEQGLISKYKYDEMLTLEIGDDSFKNSIERFKHYFNKRRPIKCSEILVDLYNEHHEGFRKAVLMSNCLPDPMGFKYNEETHEFISEVLLETINEIHGKNDLIPLEKELKEIYVALDALYHNNVENTKLLFESDFSKFTLSEQIRMCCLFLQDQSRIMTEMQMKILSERDFVTGMELAVAGLKSTDYGQVKMSQLDNFEGLIETFDVLFRYLYHAKSTDLKISEVPVHGDITHLHESSIQQVTQLASLRNIYVQSWEHFKYSNWKAYIHSENDTKYYVFEPRSKADYQRHLTAGMRRNYGLMLSILKSQGEEHDKVAYESIVNLSKSIDINNISTIFSLDKELYKNAKKYFRDIINAFDTNKMSALKEKAFDGVKVVDIVNCYEFLRTVTEVYKLAAYTEFDQEVYSTYKYTAPILDSKDLTSMFSRFYNLDFKTSDKIINNFIFNKNVRGSNDLFNRPLVEVGRNIITLCPTLIEQINLERVIESFLVNNNVDISSIGIEFEKKIRTILDIFSNIEVNTNKIEFIAYDGKDIEFDFLGKFEDTILLWEFKATTTPYSDKELYDSFPAIKKGIEQVDRRSESIQQDWDRIREMANIDLPERPVSDDKIVKLVVTNIYDYTNKICGDVQIVDESTLLKFFLNPEVKVMDFADQHSLHKTRLWKGKTPTVNEFIEYLKNPVTTSPYNKCYSSEPKVFPALLKTHPIVIIDEVISQDPYMNEINKALSINTKKQRNSLAKKKNSKRKNNTAKKSKRLNRKKR